jgi:hypothetical protein
MSSESDDMKLCLESWGREGLEENVRLAIRQCIQEWRK